MYKRFIIALVVISALTIGILYGVNNYDPHRNRPISQLIADKGSPSFIVETFDIDRRDLKILRLLILPNDPQTVTNWGAVTNVFLMWAHSDEGQFTARFYFDKMRTDKTFDGTDWYSTRYPLAGDKVTFVMVDATGKSLGKKSFRVDAFSMWMKGYKPDNPEVHRIR